jgi:Histidine kinase-, DNA gyrase B-, and HSP90-like ATPase
MLAGGDHLAPSAKEQMKMTTTAIRADLVQVDRALQSSRDSGFNLTAAAGEPVDNSIEAAAALIRIRTDRRKVDKHEEIHQIAFADNGTGIKPEILPHILSLGYSTRYNKRDGLGRFGVGLKLAALSQGQRIDVYSRPAGSNEICHVYVDLDEVREHRQEHIELQRSARYPADLVDLMRDPRTGMPFECGTLVVWSKIDRLASGGKYGTSLDERLQDLTKFLGRAYRKFIDKGLSIELNGRPIALHDPTFQLMNPRVIQKFGKALLATEIESTDIEIDGNAVHVTVTLLPEEFRRKRAAGGRADRLGEEYRELYIPENDGHVSILRQNREIYYDLVPRLYPGGVDKSGLDRFIGVEINFPAVLDEYFQVRNVKRGAEPVDQLRKALREFLKKPIESARKQIRALWDVTELEEQAENGGHANTEDVAARADKSAPRGRAGMNLTKEESHAKVRDRLKALGHDESGDAAKALQERIDRSSVTVLDGRWPGKELFAIDHLNNKSLLTLNHAHPFIRDVLDRAKSLAASVRADEPLTAEGVDSVRFVADGIELFLMAYARAENMHEDPDEAYGDLRTQLGIAADSYIRDRAKKS